MIAEIRKLFALNGRLDIHGDDMRFGNSHLGELGQSFQTMLTNVRALINSMRIDIRRRVAEHEDAALPFQLEELIHGQSSGYELRLAVCLSEGGTLEMGMIGLTPAAQMTVPVESAEPSLAESLSPAGVTSATLIF